MKVTKEMQKQEALERMKMLQLHKNAINEFRIQGVVNLSERFGVLYWLNEQQQQIVKDFEIRHHAVVYHAIHNFTEFGEMLALLFVSSYQEEWEEEQEELQRGMAIAYVKNLDDENCSEFGSIGIQPSFGGLRRTA